TVQEIEVFLRAGEVVRTDGSRLFRTRVNGTDEQYVNPLATEDGMPGYAVQWVEVEGPFFDDPVGGAGYRVVVAKLRLGAAGAGPCRGRSARLPRQGAAGAADRGASAAGQPCARRSTRSSPRSRAKMPSGYCARS